MEYAAQIDLTKVSEINFKQWADLLREAGLNANETNPYWLQFDPMGKLNGVLSGAFIFLVCVASLVGNLMIAVHSFK